MSGRQDWTFSIISLISSRQLGKRTKVLFLQLSRMQLHPFSISWKSVCERKIMMTTFRRPLRLVYCRFKSGRLPARRHNIYSCYSEGRLRGYQMNAETYKFLYKNGMKKVNTFTFWQYIISACRDFQFSDAENT